MRNPVDAARSTRPTRNVTVLEEGYLIRQPSMKTVRDFQARRVEDPRGAMLGFLQECLAREDGKFDLTDEEAGELADMQWVSQPLLGKILRFANGQPDDPTAAELAGEPEEPEAPQPAAG
jgi:hypothetical protein